jgi:hypothetical protein
VRTNAFCRVLQRALSSIYRDRQHLSQEIAKLAGQSVRMQGSNVAKQQALQGEDEDMLKNMEEMMAVTRRLEANVQSHNVTINIHVCVIQPNQCVQICVIVPTSDTHPHILSVPHVMDKIA